MIQIRQRIPGCLRTPTGAEQFTAIRPYRAITANNGIDCLEWHSTRSHHT